LPANVTQRCDKAVEPRRLFVGHLEAALGDRLRGRTRKPQHVAERILKLPHGADVGGLDGAGARQLVHGERHQRDLGKRLDGLDGAAGSFGLEPQVWIADDVADRQAVQRALLHRAIDALAAFGVEIDQPALALQAVGILAHRVPGADRQVGHRIGAAEQPAAHATVIEELFSIVPLVW